MPHTHKVRDPHGLENVIQYRPTFRAVATLRHEEAIAYSLYERRKNGIGVMTHELTFSESVVESQHLLKLQSGKSTKMPSPATAKCPRQTSCCQSLDAFSRAQSVTNAFGGGLRISFGSCAYKLLRTGAWGQMYKISYDNLTIILP